MANRMLVGSDGALRPGERALVEAGGHEVVVFNVAGRCHAVQNRCPHAGAPLLSSGSIRDGRLVCGWHDLCFDLASGESDSGWELRVYRTGLDEKGRLFVELP
jgi:3-phenylpropionate/trans-cinnamate dioxygenase ferredoxin subunit